MMMSNRKDKKSKRPSPLKAAMPFPLHHHFLPLLLQPTTTQQLTILIDRFYKKR
jgi:hypothetical protein